MGDDTLAAGAAQKYRQCRVSTLRFSLLWR
jgi:hypothetical protein